MSGAMPCLHCVAIAGRTNRKRIINVARPTRRTLNAFLASFGPLAAPDSPTSALATVAQPRSSRGWQNGMHDAELVLDWLGASKFVRSVRGVGNRRQSRSLGCLRGHWGATAAELSADLKRVHPEILRRGRARLDCAVMVLSRHLWRASARAAATAMPNIYLFVDASPQWRGLELYASSMFDGFPSTRDYWMRREMHGAALADIIACRPVLFLGPLVRQQGAPPDDGPGS